jgi:hypothetical protein
VEPAARWLTGNDFGPHLVQRKNPQFYGKLKLLPPPGRGPKPALAAATGVSLGIAYTVPSLFLPAFDSQPNALSQLRNLRLLPDEEVGSEDCYAIRGSVSAGIETYWISKSGYFIVKSAVEFEHAARSGVQHELTDAQMDQVLRQMGQKPTEEARMKLREILKHAEAVRSREAPGSLVHTTYVNLSSPVLNQSDFQFALPKDAVLKHSLLTTVVEDGAAESGGPKEKP